MPKVTYVIAVLYLILLFSGCDEGKKSVEFKLPESVEHAKPGKVNHITAAALVDSVNSGVKLRMFFLYDLPPDNPAYIVNIPGMKQIQLGDMFYMAETLSTEQPVYLVCLYGDDSKKIAENVAVYGINSYYLDGGSYRLWEEMNRYGWSFKPQSFNLD